MDAQPHPVQPGNAAVSSLIASPATPTPGADSNPHRGAFSGGTRSKPIFWRGRVYPSQKALAIALGLSEQRVSEAIKLGRLRSLGTGPKGRMTPACKAAGVAALCQPCAAHGWQWPSQKAAADALGCKAWEVSRALDRGTFDRLVLQRLGVKA